MDFAFALVDLMAGFFFLIHPFFLDLRSNDFGLLLEGLALFLVCISHHSFPMALVFQLSIQSIHGIGRRCYPK